MTYGEAKVFSTGATLPVVTTASMSEVTFETATTGGKVTFNGGAPIVKAGVCWGKTENPDLEGLYTEDEVAADGSFVSHIDGLEPDQTFYVRAYATNEIGTSFGEQIVFSASSEPCIEALAEEALMAYVLANYDLNNDGKIQISEAEGVNVIDVPSAGITSIAGLEQFENLADLRLNGNALTQVDLTPFKKLEIFWGFEQPSLVSVNTTGLENLKYFHCQTSGLASVDFTTNVNLMEANLFYTQISSIDLSSCMNLQTLNLEGCPVADVDVSDHASLWYCNVRLNDTLNSLDVQGCSALTELYFDTTPITEVDASNLESLRILWGFALKSAGGSVKADNCPALEYMHCYNSNLAVCSAKNCPNLREFRCFGNPDVTEADFTGSFTTNPGEINLDGSHLTSFKIAKDNTLWYLNICQNRLSELDFAGGFTLLEQFFTNASTLTKINVEGLPSLKFMHSCDNLTEGHLSVYADNCPELYETIFQNAKLDKFFVRNCPKLYIYRVWGSPDLEGVDATGCHDLFEINSDGAALTYLRISGEENPNLGYLNIHGNRLEDVDLSSFTKLQFLHCGNARAMKTIKYASSLEEIYQFNNTMCEVNDVSGLNRLRIFWSYGDDMEGSRAAVKNIIFSGNSSLVVLRAFRTYLQNIDIRQCADNMDEALLDANPLLTRITMRSSQTIGIFNRDPSVEVDVQ